MQRPYLIFIFIGCVQIASARNTESGTIEYGTTTHTEQTHGHTTLLAELQTSEVTPSMSATVANDETTAFEEQSTTPNQTQPITGTTAPHRTLDDEKVTTELGTIISEQTQTTLLYEDQTGRETTSRSVTVGNDKAKTFEEQSTKMNTAQPVTGTTSPHRTLDVGEVSTEYRTASTEQTREYTTLPDVKKEETSMFETVNNEGTTTFEKQSTTPNTTQPVTETTSPQRTQDSQDPATTAVTLPHTEKRDYSTISISESTRQITVQEKKTSHTTVESNTQSFTHEVSTSLMTSSSDIAKETTLEMEAGRTTKLATSLDSRPTSSLTETTEGMVQSTEDEGTVTMTTDGGKSMSTEPLNVIGKSTSALESTKAEDVTTVSEMMTEQTTLPLEIDQTSTEQEITSASENYIDFTSDIVTVEPESSTITKMNSSPSSTSRVATLSSASQKTTPSATLLTTTISTTTMATTTSTTAHKTTFSTTSRTTPQSTQVITLTSTAAIKSTTPGLSCEELVCNKTSSSTCSSVGPKPVCVCRPGYHRPEWSQQCQESGSFQNSLRITSCFGKECIFTLQLQDSDSIAYRELADDICQAIDTIFKYLSETNSYLGCEVGGFTSGSVIADYFSFFQSNSDVTEEQVAEVIKDGLNNSTLPGTSLIVDQDSITSSATNECNLQFDDCDKDAICIDQGSKGFTCKCADGYRDDSNDGSPGRVCIEEKTNIALLVALLLIAFLLVLLITIVIIKACLSSKLNAASQYHSYDVGKIELRDEVAFNLPVYNPVFGILDEEEEEEEQEKEEYTEGTESVELNESIPMIYPIDLDPIDAQSTKMSTFMVKNKTDETNPVVKSTEENISKTEVTEPRSSRVFIGAEQPKVFIGSETSQAEPNLKVSEGEVKLESIEKRPTSKTPEKEAKPSSTKKITATGTDTASVSHFDRPVSANDSRMQRCGKSLSTFTS